MTNNDIISDSELLYVFETAASGIRIINNNFIVTAVNNTFCTMFGLIKKEVVGSKCYELLASDFCNTPLCRLNVVTRDKQSIHFQTDRRLSNANIVKCIETVLPLQGIDGQVLGIIEHFNDITHIREQERTRLDFQANIEKRLLKRTVELGKANRQLLSEIEDRKRAQEETRNLNEGLEQLVQERTAEIESVNIQLEKAIERAHGLAQEAEMAGIAKGDFLARMSHEIRTPLNAIIGMTRLALNLDLDSKLRDYLGTINTSGYLLLGLINNILDFSKIDAGKLDLEIRDFRLHDILENLRVLFQEKVLEKGLEMVINVKDDIPPILIGDSLRLSQILVNLTGNAIKFTEKGRIKLDVNCFNKTDTELMLQFMVSDTGMGILSESIERLFNPFSQMDDSITRRYGGTGLGLAICKQIVEAMSGRIWVDSQAGEGSNFYFTVLFGYKTEATETTHGILTGLEWSRRLSDVDDIFIQERLSGSRVLVAEDNSINQKVMTEMLKNVGIAVDIARNGKEAVSMAGVGSYDCILMDMTMPEMDGIEATRVIRKAPRLKDLPVIGVTASVSKNDREEWIDAGVDDYIIKPVEPDILYSKLAALIPKKKGFQQPDRVQQVSRDLVENQIETSLALLQGLDIRAGLRRVVGNKKLYCQILEEFLRDHSDTAFKIKSAIEANDLMLGHNLAHTLKGVAGNIGAMRLNEAARGLETATDGAIIESYDGLIDAIDAAFLETAYSIRVFLNRENRHPDYHNTPDVERVNDIAGIRSMLERFETLLREQDMESAMQAAFIVEPLCSLGLNVEAARLSEYVSRFDFKKALEVVKTISGRLKGRVNE
ncbi:MAG: ATP-binding protein [Pseudomonadota bacterium]